MTAGERVDPGGGRAPRRPRSAPARPSGDAPPARAIGGLVAAAHVGPSLAVTIMAILLGVWAGVAPGRLVLLALAVASGQASIGWLNDWWDAPRDAAVGRGDKPVVSGLVSRTAVGRAALVAAVACVATSAALGWAGAVHLVAVASAWAYDLGLKATLASAVPYAVSFGLLPAVATLAADPPTWPATWVVVAAAALGVGGHLANALPDLDDDRRTQIRSLPVRLGPRATTYGAAAALGAGAVVVAVGSPATPTVGLLAVTAALLVGVVAASRAGRPRTAFGLVVAVALVIVSGFVWTA